MAKNLIIFDFDNTIVTSLYYWYNIMDKETFKHFGIKIDKNFTQKRKGKGNFEIAQTFVDLYDKSLSPYQIIDFWNERMTFYYKNNIKLIKGVKEFLESLKQKNKIMCILSSTDTETIEKALKHFDLAQYFSGIFTEKTLGIPKYKPDLLKYCLKQMNQKQEETFFFEDSLASLKCAKMLNIDSCGVIHKYNKFQAKQIKEISNLTIKNYKNVEKLIQL